MKYFLGLGLLVFVGTLGWWVGGLLSREAMVLVVGVLFCLLVGIPTVAVLASERRYTRAVKAQCALKEHEAGVSPQALSAGRMVGYE